MRWDHLELLPKVKLTGTLILVEASDENFH
jgi:hypothetical protein